MHGAYTGARARWTQGPLLRSPKRSYYFLEKFKRASPRTNNAKLLRFLQERMYRPIGGNQEKSVHLEKLWAASNKQSTGPHG